MGTERAFHRSTLQVVVTGSGSGPARGVMFARGASVFLRERFDALLREPLKLDNAGGGAA